jgi:hypothetical protein
VLIIGYSVLGSVEATFPGLGAKLLVAFDTGGSDQVGTAVEQHVVLDNLHSKNLQDYES